MKKFGCLAVVLAFASAPIALGLCDTKAETTKKTELAAKSSWCQKGSATAVTTGLKSSCSAKQVILAALKVQGGVAGSKCCGVGKAATLTAAAKAACTTACTTVITAASKGVCCSSVSVASSKAACLAAAKACAAAAKSGCCSKNVTTAASKSTAGYAGKSFCGFGKTAAAKSGCSKGAATLASAGVGRKSKGSFASCHPNFSKVSTVMASLPSMTYRVGDFETRCSKTAGVKADSSGKPLVYLVANKAYENKGAAMVALTSLLEQEAKTLTTVRFAVGDKCYSCPVSAKQVAANSDAKVKYRVGGFDFDDKAIAQAIAEAANEAAAKMAMTYKVDGKEISCAKSAKSCGKPLTFVVGDSQTGCEMTAKLTLAQAKIEAIVKTAALGAPSKPL